MNSKSRLVRQQDPAKADELTAWLDQLADTWNVLSRDGTVFREWARLMHRKSNTLYEDAVLAATARVHGLTVVTHNVADFKPFKVPLLNPFAKR